MNKNAKYLLRNIRLNKNIFGTNLKYFSETSNQEVKIKNFKNEI